MNRRRMLHSLKAGVDLGDYEDAAPKVKRGS